MSAIPSRSPRISTRQVPSARQIKALVGIFLNPVVDALPIPKGRASNRNFAVIIFALLLFATFAQLMVASFVQQVSFQKHALQIQLSQATAERQLLESQVAKAESPENLLNVAKRMGMVPEANPVFLRLSDHTILGKRNPAR